MDDGLIEVVVAVGMAGARQGQYRWVNADDPYIQERLQLGFLQRTGRTMTGGEAEITTEEGPVDEGQGDVASPPEPEVVAEDG